LGEVLRVPGQDWGVVGEGNADDLQVQRAEVGLGGPSASPSAIMTAAD